MMRRGIENLDENSKALLMQSNNKETGKNCKGGSASTI
jgi:hypothetical protein